MKIDIDFFSDSNTEPTIEMRETMAKAKVGNEAAGEDPTVNELVSEVCELLGKPAGIFLPSGTMCNVIAYKAHVNRIFITRLMKLLILINFFKNSKLTVRGKIT